MGYIFEHLGVLVVLTDTAIRRAKLREKPYKLFDGKGLRSGPTDLDSFWVRISVSLRVMPLLSVTAG